MLNNKTVAVVVPAFNEEKQIIFTINNMPDFVDHIIIVDDASSDNTLNITKTYILKNQITNDAKVSQSLRENIDNIFNKADKILLEIKEQEEKYYIPSKNHTESDKKNSLNKFILLEHSRNSGVGAAITTGYKWARDNNIDCIAVMAGDGQMDPAELLSICNPIINENVDYTKGNRLNHKAAKKIVPKHRFIGNSILSLLTKIASGYWKVSDTQTGYTAISKDALRNIDLYDIYKSYGMPNDLLVKLNIASMVIKEIPIKPIYNVGEKSKMKVYKVIPKVSLLLIKLFFKRLFIKYLFKNFHPLFICYIMFIILSIISIYLLSFLIRDYFFVDIVNKNYLLAFCFCAFTSIQFLLFGMWFDMQDNDRLQK